MAASKNDYPVYRLTLSRKSRLARTFKNLAVLNVLSLLIFSSLFAPLIQFNILNSRPLDRLFETMAAEQSFGDESPIYKSEFEKYGVALIKKNLSEAEFFYK